VLCRFIPCSLVSNNVLLAVIFVDGNTNRELTYAEMRDQSNAFGIGLKSMWEWKRGDVLAVFRCVAASGVGKES
jgi:acyl-coenzyme A synthetase/AMP-(fatty) acid ligase